MLLRREFCCQILVCGSRGGRYLRRHLDGQPPLLVESSGQAARFAWDEYIYGCLRKEHTRRSYERACRRFLSWCEHCRLDLHAVSPKHVGKYLDSLPDSSVSKKVCLAAIRHLFDILVTRHAAVLNPADSVRGERLQVIEDKTPEMSAEQARRLLNSIDTSHVVGLRARAIVAILIYTAARVGAVARLRLGDFFDAGTSSVCGSRTMAVNRAKYRCDTTSSDSYCGISK